MKVDSIAECSVGAFCNTFDLHLAIIGLENQLLVFLRVAVLHRFYFMSKSLLQTELADIFSRVRIHNYGAGSGVVLDCIDS